MQSALRHIEFLDSEIAAVERLIARAALDSADARRLMTVPGVNVICAATFIAAVGDIRRFRTSAALVGYLGLDPRVRQSGNEPAQGRPDLQARLGLGALGAGRGGLVGRSSNPAAARLLSAHARPPRPRQGDRRRRAQARGPVLVPARRGEDYAHQQPSLTAKKLRRAEITAGAPTQQGKQTGVCATRERMRHAERELAQQAEASYTRMVSDWQAARPPTKPAAPNKAGASVTPGRAPRPSKGNVARQTTSP